MREKRLWLSAFVMMVLFMASHLCAQGRGMQQGRGLQQGRGMQRGQGGPHMGGPGKPGRHQMEEVFRNVNLTQDQRKQLVTMRRAHRKKMHIIRSQMREKRYNLSEQLISKKLNDSVINKLIDDIAKLEKETLTTRIELVKSIRNILKPEQIEKIHFDMLWNSGRGRHMRMDDDF